jgi:hypothetical protein
VAKTTCEQRTLKSPDGNTLLSVWLRPTSTVALCNIRLTDGLSATDGVNRALQAYALLLEGSR